ncbi:MAG: AAA family ATPase, partial [Phycisphaerales bacterium]|nr:AAA family ATPase [Phycisphaerales bacterium]
RRHMKIEQIDLQAYGHFTAQRLALGGAANLHIICGPNEAGKTTLWRAINGALFGIPETTRDGHLHGNPKLRVGLALSSRAGDRLAVMRRKGRVNTLLSYDPKTGAELAETVPEERLRDWLGGLSQGLFLAMFSLDHDALVRGGAALAQGKGDAGESLFEAGAGLGSIRALRTRLDGEAEALFKPRARNSAISRALSDYDGTRRRAKDATVRPVEWSAAKSAMETASRDYQTALAEQVRLQKEARRLERLAAILPEVAALELVDLDDQARATIDALIEQRAAFLDGAVLEHYQTLLELYAAFGAGDQTEVARLYMEFAGHLQPLFEGGGLARQLAREMRPAQAREYGRLIREYYQAVAQDALDHPEATRGSAATLQDALRNERIGVLMQEVGRSFGRIVQQKSQELEDVLAALRLDPDREAQIRALVEEIAGDFGLNPSESEKREIFTRIMGELTPGERQRLMAWILR